MKTSERGRSLIASPTTSSAPPSPYISAVSMSVIPRSKPKRSAAISSCRREASSPIIHVPCPNTGTGRPDGNNVVLIPSIKNRKTQYLVKILRFWCFFFAIVTQLGRQVMFDPFRRAHFDPYLYSRPKPIDDQHQAIDGEPLQICVANSG